MRRIKHALRVLAGGRDYARIQAQIDAYFDLTDALRRARDARLS